jgi:uncharacterized membrane protein
VCYFFMCYNIQALNDQIMMAMLRIFEFILMVFLFYIMFLIRWLLKLNNPLGQLYFILIICYQIFILLNQKTEILAVFSHLPL